MKKVGLWVARNFGLPIVMVISTLITFSIYELREIDAQEYRVLRGALETGGQAFPAAVAEAMSNGEVSQWERTGLFQKYWKDSTALSLNLEAMSLPAERSALAVAVANKTVQP